MSPRYLRVSVLAENTARGRNILGEHGLAFWIDTGEYKILFDTGQGLALASNAEAMNIPLSEANAIVLSHGHDDHTGGLQTALQHAPHAPLFLHPSALETKFTRSAGGGVRKISSPFLDSGEMEKAGRTIQYVMDPTEIVPGIFATGPIPRLTIFEDTGGAFFLDEEMQKPDVLVDDQAVYFQTSEGLVVILGCAHAGVVNTLGYIAQITGTKTFHTIMGGMHLLRADDNRLKHTVQAFEQYQIQRIGANHCTGARAIALLWQTFPDRCFECTAGTNIDYLP